jgi:hypothetical protein
MALPKKGSRKIIVDGLTYRWYICRKPSYGQAFLGVESMTVAIQRDTEEPVTNLWIHLHRSRPDAWFSDRTPITPKNIAQYIRTALEKGWQADRAGKPFILKETE